MAESKYTDAQIEMMARNVMAANPSVLAPEIRDMLRSLLAERQAVVHSVSDKEVVEFKAAMFPALENLKLCHIREALEHFVNESAKDAARYREMMSTHNLSHPNELIDTARYANQFRSDWWDNKESWDVGLDFSINPSNEESKE